MKENLLPFEKIEREIFVKKQAETNPNQGINPEERPTEELINYGIINLNKPRGPSSHQISAYVQQILGIDKKKKKKKKKTKKKQKIFINIII